MIENFKYKEQYHDNHNPKIKNKKIKNNIKG